MAFAEKTVVSPDKSRAEIEALLRRYGATEFGSAWSADGRALIQFSASGRLLRFELTLPSPNEKRFTLRPNSSYRLRPAALAREAHEQEVRRLWRALALVVKAKLEAVQSGITTFESEFLAHIVMPDGKTVGQHVAPTIAAAYETGRVRALLPAFTGGEE
jgi:hypothetical protein